MKRKRNVLIVLGGTSKERKVSLASGKACFKAIEKLGYKAIKFDPANELLSSIKGKKIELIFNALHGKDGEDGHIQSYFEYLKIPYTHSGVLPSMNAMDKGISKNIFKKNKILTPKYFLINNNFKINKLQEVLKKENLKFPVVVKPINEGSSIGVKICKNFKSLRKNTKALLKSYNELIFENFIDGQEIQVALMNNQALGAIELQTRRKFYDYKAKYMKSAKTLHIMPANITKDNYKKVLKIAEKAHKALKCKGVTRCDFKLYKNKFYLLELNTQPGMTNLSLVPEIAAYKGISFQQLVKAILLDASINK